MTKRNAAWAPPSAPVSAIVRMPCYECLNGFWTFLDASYLIAVKKGGRWMSSRRGGTSRCLNFLSAWRAAAAGPQADKIVRAYSRRPIHGWDGCTRARENLNQARAAA